MTMRSHQHRIFSPVKGKCFIVVSQSLVVACVAFLCSEFCASVKADDAALDPERDIRQVVLGHLRNGDIEQSLHILAGLVDRTGSISIADDDQLFPIYAGLHRALSQLENDEKYELLSRWTMPDDATPNIRLLTGLVPTIAPPVEFARLIRQQRRIGFVDHRGERVAVDGKAAAGGCGGERHRGPALRQCDAVRCDGQAQHQKGG